MKMRMVTLVENTERPDFLAEHGLSLYIEYADKKILLDAGKSDCFVKNAKKLDICLEEADMAVLSHAHYDHGDGFPYFFDRNEKAVLYISENAKENCYGGVDRHYIGLQKGFLKKYGSRIVYTRGVFEISRGIYLVPHSTLGLGEIGEENELYRLEDGKMVPDDFNHEQSLVFRKKDGLVIFNSCSHGHVDHIIEEVQQAFPEEKVSVFVGGFHLSKSEDEFVREYARSIKKYGLQKIYTGHCTGNQAFKILNQEVGTIVDSLWSGRIVEL